MNYIATLTLIGFLGIMLFLFMPMNNDSGHGMDHAGADCPIAALFNALCGRNGVSMDAAHISAFQTFFNIPLSSAGIFLSLFIALGSVLLLCICSLRIDAAAKNILAVWTRLRRDSEYRISERQKLFWLSLLEHSPSY